jgi:hypothetical protein
MILKCYYNNHGRLIVLLLINKKKIIEILKNRLVYCLK